MEQNITPTNSDAGKSLGIAGLIVGILATLFSCIPCIGMWGIVPGVIGVILSAISMKQAGANGQKGMAIAGLITSVIGILIACYWLYIVFFITSAAVHEAEKTGFADSLAKTIQMASDSISAHMKKLEEITDTSKTH